MATALQRRLGTEFAVELVRIRLNMKSQANLYVAMLDAGRSVAEVTEKMLKDANGFSRRLARVQQAYNDTTTDIEAGLGDASVNLPPATMIGELAFLQSVANATKQANLSNDPNIRARAAQILAIGNSALTGITFDTQLTAWITDCSTFGLGPILSRPM